MSGDARIWAWITASNRLEYAAKLREAVHYPKGHDQQPEAPLPDLYWAIISEADVFSRLAAVSTSVGFNSNVWLERVEAQRAESMTPSAENFLMRDHDES